MKNAIKALELMGYKILAQSKPSANGPDLHIEKNGVIFRVEVKKARISKRSAQVPAVELNRRVDDLIAIELPSGYVLIEPMDHHLKNCAKNCGTRSLFGIY